jgi:hypothetical protein
MGNLTEGDWGCTVLGASCGQDDKEQLVVRVNVRIDDGPDKGRSCTYEDTINNKSAPYIARSLKAAGWSGKLPLDETLTADVEAWVKETGGKSTVTIEHLEIKKGKQFDKWMANGAKPSERPIWAKVKALGRGPKPLSAVTKATSSDANDFMRRALEEQGGSAPPMDDVPPPDDNEIPFATTAWTRVNGGVL